MAAKDNAWNEERQVQELPAVQGKLHHLFTFHGGARGGGLCLELRRGGFHGDGGGLVVWDPTRNWKLTLTCDSTVSSITRWVSLSNQAFSAER